MCYFDSFVSAVKPPMGVCGLLFHYHCTMFINFFNQKIYNNTLYDWVFSLVIVVASVIVARLVYWLISKILRQYTKETDTAIDDLIIKKLDAPIALGVVLIGIRYALKLLEFPRLVNGYVHRGFVLMVALTATWLLTRIVRGAIEYYFNSHAETAAEKANKQIMMMAKRASVVLIWAIGIVVGLNNAGFDVGALIAGLGIGGLALALAAQDTVKNIIGGMVVFIDKPFYIGDVIKIKETEGTVVYTGIRSTRIRMGNGRIVTIPNSYFTDSAIENITLEPAKRIVNHLLLPFETPVEKIDEGITILKNIIEHSPDVNHYDAIIFLEKFSQSSVDINFTYHIKKGSDIHATQTDINLQILQKFKQAGIEFAYPTQVSIERKTPEDKASSDSKGDKQ
ncbi:MAG TPA: mechanosensitive ion channel family protein [Chitinophagales bacterium]|nr:mechanosensitive ion channel family protein [Chitinophagales bacterium]